MLLKTRSPLLQVISLEWSNRLRGASRSRGRARWLLALLVMAVVSVLLALAAIWPVLLPVAEPNITAIAVLAALSLSIWTHWSRMRWTQYYLHSWVSTLPVSQRAKHALVALRSFALSG